MKILSPSTWGSKRLPVAWLLVFFVLLSAVPLALMLFFSVRLTAETVEREAKGRVRVSAATATRAIEKELQGFSELVESYARRPTLIAALEDGRLSTADRRAMGPLLPELRSAREGIATTFLADESGRLLAITPATPSIVGDDFSFRDWYRGVTSTGSTYISEVYRSQATGRPIVVAAASPVEGKSGFEGVIVAAWDLTELQDFVQGFTSSEAVDLRVTDQRGAVIAGPGSLPQALVSRALDPDVASALAGRSGSGTRSTSEGAIFSAYEPVPRVGWTVTASIPHRRALGPLRELQAKELKVAAVLGLVLLGGLWLLYSILHGRRRAEAKADQLRVETERVRDELQEARSFLEHLIASSPMVIFRTTSDRAQLTYVSPNIERLLGYSVTEVVGVEHFWRAHMHPDDLARLSARGREVESRGEDRIEADYRFLHKDGSYRWLHSVMRLDPLAVEGAGTVLAYAQDITESIEAQETTSRLASIVESTGDAVIGNSPEGAIVSWNSSAEALYGYSADEIKGRPVSILTPDDRRQEIDQILQAVAEGRRIDNHETERMKKGGERIEVALTISPIRDASGAVIGASTIARDITDRKRAEQTLRESAEELRAAKQEAERANQAKNDFLSRMSHELRTPLNAILGFAQLMEMDSLSSEHRESTNEIRRGGGHLLELIDEIMDISRIESGQLTLSLEPIPLGELVEHGVAMVRSLAEERSIEIRGDARASCTGHVLGDRQRFTQVLLNILSNAIKYNREGGEVTISYEEVGSNRLNLKIADTGYGIRAHNLDRLFSPFDRLGAEQSGVQGTGLGLTLSKRLMEAMGGDIRVDTSVGEGTTFTLEFQVAQSHLELLEEAEEVTPIPERDLGGSHTILCIEDNFSNLKLLTRIFSHRPGVSLLTALQASIGIDLAREHRPDVILLDLNLPDIDGLEALERLQADPRTAHIPVVIISADATRNQVETLLEAGATDYVPKPFSVAGLLRTVDALLVRDEPAAS
ncbi:MAG: PAS domain S-box protein [Actinomycetota bacterium]|nr:PAS domain S-box protein [Actinomycetota bacterium]